MGSNAAVARWLKFLLGGVGLVLFALICALAYAPYWLDGMINRVEGPPLSPVSAEAQALHESLFVADLHVTNQFIVQTGPGVEFLHGPDEEEFVYRVGVLYEWEVNGYTVSPQVHYDWTEEEDTVLFGLAFGLCF